MNYLDFKRRASTAIAESDTYIGQQTPIFKLFAPDMAAFCWMGKLDLDTDGKATPAIIHWDADHQAQTSIDSAGSWLISNDVSYFVVPGHFPHSVPMGTLATVFYNGNHEHSLAGDFGPTRKLGEGSQKLQRVLGNETVAHHSVLNVGIDRGVTFLVYLGSEKLLRFPCTQADLDAAAEPLFAAWRNLPVRN